MKITKEYLRRVIKEELERSLQEAELSPEQKRIVDMYNTVTEIRPIGAPFQYTPAADKKTVQVAGKVQVSLQGSKTFEVPISTTVQIRELFPTQNSLSDYREIYKQMAPFVIAAMENLYNKKYGIINMLPYEKMVEAWNAGESEGSNAIGNIQKLVADLRAAGAVAGKPAGANPQSSQGTMT